MWALKHHLCMLLFTSVMPETCCTGILVTPTDLYVWNKTEKSALEFLTDFGLETCTLPNKEAKIYEGWATCYSHKALPCSCDHGCEPYGSCCYDRMENLTTAWTETGCIENVYYAMVRCPEWWHEGDIREACETLPGNYSFDEPVTDLDTGITYRNQFCAQCHDVDTYTPWPLKVTCDHFQFMYMVSTEEVFLRLARTASEICSIKREPPKEFKPLEDCPQFSWLDSSNQPRWKLASSAAGSAKLDEQASNNTVSLFFAISECNVTGDWAPDDYDPDIESNCLKYNGLSLRMRGSFTYGNLFCAMCNGVKPYTLPCPDKSGEIEPTPWGQPPMSLLLRLKDRELGNDDGREPDACLPGQWMDVTVSMLFLKFSDHQQRFMTSNS